MSKLIIKNRYGVIPDKILNDKNLSLKAKGMFGYLQSKPDGWRFSVERITSQMKEGRDSIRRTLQELEKAGYLQRKLVYDNQKKKFNGYDYILSDKPILPKTNPTENQSTGFSEDISKKDDSKIDIVKKNNNIATQSVAGKEINDLIELFKDVNPSYKRLFSNKTQREAIKRMLKQYGREKLERMIKGLKRIFGQPYAPTITTPYQLELKMGDYANYIIKKSKEKIPFIDFSKVELKKQNYNTL